MKRFALGVDNGGTVIKAALFSSEGDEIAVVSRMTPVLTPAPGHTERDMESLWRDNCVCIRQVVEKSGISPDEIIGVAFCGHGKGLYTWGKDGRPVGNGIVSTDNRAWQYPARWFEDGTWAAQYPKLCQRLMACQQISLLAWMKDHVRDKFDQIRWVFSVKDYIRFRMTGEAFFESTDFSGSGLMNVRDARVDGEMLESFGLGEVAEMVPPVCNSGDFCGAVTKEASELTGLRAGTPVAGGMFDIDACAIAMSVTKPEQMCTITGTWSINEFISKTPVLGTDISMNSLYAIPGYYLIEESSATSAGNLEWVVQNLFRNEPLPPGMKIYQLIDELVSSVPPDASEVYFLPFLYGSSEHPLAKASFLGMTSFHTRAHMLRAVYEGVTFSAKKHIDRLLSVRERPSAIRLAGGAANSRLWVQIFADVLGFPIETVNGVSELGALGAAMAASVAAKVFGNYEEAAETMVKISPPIPPDLKANAIYKQKFDKYETICKALNQIWGCFES
ncbi:MAG: carbohydrate kinase [Synergistaceae bacterium]|jgi:L-xylulokinase|nr:carbohydrate kinase [Synergistaceae bacterium]